MAQTVSPGRVVLVPANRDLQGVDELPALVVDVHDLDAEVVNDQEAHPAGQGVTVWVFPIVGVPHQLAGIRLFDSREAWSEVPDKHRPAVAAFWPTYVEPAPAAGKASKKTES